MFETEDFRKLMYCIEEALVTLLGLFGAPVVIRRSHGDWGPGELCSPCPLVAPRRWDVQNWSVFCKYISLMPDNSLERKGSSENRNVI